MVKQLFIEVIGFLYSELKFGRNVIESIENAPQREFACQRNFIEKARLSGQASKDKN